MINALAIIGYVTVIYLGLSFGFKIVDKLERKENKLREYEERDGR